MYERSLHAPHRWRGMLVWLGLASVVLPACGGFKHESTPPESPATGTLSGTTTVDTFTVGPEERIACQGDVTVNCRTAAITGEMYAQPATAAGADGGSITIVASGDVAVTGSVTAGAGVAGGANSAGGAGGDVELRSTGGDLTVGSPTATRQDGSGSVLAGGDGAVGGDGLTGGAGGSGGLVLLSCPEGVLTIHEVPGLIHVGSGGAGGRSVVGGADLLTLVPPDQPANQGGGSGACGAAAREIVGGSVDPEPMVVDGREYPVVVLAETTMTGGAGGSGGSAYDGVDPVTLESTWPASRGGRQDRATRKAKGGRGERGCFRGGAGGDAHVRAQSVTGRHGDIAQADGGAGGNCEVMPHLTARIDQLGQNAHLFMRDEFFVAGRGGDAVATGGDGQEGEPGQAGGEGGTAYAKGGDAGDVFWFRAGRDRRQVSGGRGGNATARGGAGGRGGGYSCPATLPGGPGAVGGHGNAAGGEGSQRVAGDVVIEYLGAGGSAEATGGHGGDGGQGTPGGSAGRGGTVYAKAGAPAGTPPAETAVPGADGAKGPDCQPATQTRRYQLTAVSSTSDALSFKDWYEVTGPVVSGRQSGGLGGSANPIHPYTGQNVEMNDGATRLYVASQPGELRVYRNPLDGGDRPPDFWLSPQGNGTQTNWYSIELDTTNDRLYALDTEGSVWVWNNAGSLSADRAADRRIDLRVDNRSPRTIVVSPSKDKLFATELAKGGYQVLVVGQVSLRSGTTPPDREFKLKSETLQSSEGLGGLAYDGTRDLLYLGRIHNNTKRVEVVAQASTISGEAEAARRIAGSATGVTDVPLGLHYFATDDLLFVAVQDADLLLFDQASSRDGNTTPTKQEHLAEFLLGVGVWQR